MAVTWVSFLSAMYMKNHSTVKFLIGITPQGTISYVSMWKNFRQTNCGTVWTFELPFPSDVMDNILGDRSSTSFI